MNNVVFAFVGVGCEFVLESMTGKFLQLLLCNAQPKYFVSLVLVVCFMFRIWLFSRPAVTFELNVQIGFYVCIDVF